MGGKVHLSRGSESFVVKDRTRHWYAYAANSTHILDSIMNGSRVSLEYEIFDAGTAVIGAAFDPLAPGNHDVATRTQVSAKVRADAQVALKAELEQADALVITLQYLYADEAELSVLEGGDRALFDTLKETTDADSAGDVFEVELVKVTLQYKFDPALHKKVLESATYSYFTERKSDHSDASASTAASAAADKTKLIIPIKLTEQHRAAAEEEGQYSVSALRVRLHK